MSLRRLLWLILFFVCATCQASDPLPRVDTRIDPAKSFWTEHVHYAFPHQFAKVQDGQGRTWEIAYADLFAGDAGQKAKAPVLVLLHGRGMNAGYWGQLLDRPLAAGWRVVAIDWTHSGKSLPRNLHLPAMRSLDDARVIVHNLVVKHLGLTKASYLGHSLGGQLMAGYALKYPDHVARLVLYAPGGLQSIAAFERNGFRFDDPTLERRQEAFLAAWKSGILPSMGASREQIERSFYVSGRPGSVAYLKRGDPLSEFIVASRASSLEGNAQERERFQQSYAADTLATMAEIRVEDANSLPARAPKIKVPTLLALGAKDPVITVDLAKPFHMMTSSYKSPVTIKIYEEGGHYLHTDLPEQFSRDVLEFLTSGKVPEPIYRGAEPPPRTPLATLPDDVRALKESAEAAFATRDLEAIRKSFHPDFRDDGQTIQARLDFIAPGLPYMTHWRLVVFGVERESDDTMTLDIEAHTNFGVYPQRWRLKKVDGVWFNYGNQR